MAVIRNSLLCCFLSAVWVSLVIAEATQVQDDEARGQAADKVTNLPGQPPATFPHYAGYVNLQPPRSHKALFYWFFHAQHSAPQKPLVLWLNGGDYPPFPSSSFSISIHLYGYYSFFPFAFSVFVRHYDPYVYI